MNKVETRSRTVEYTLSEEDVKRLLNITDSPKSVFVRTPPFPWHSWDTENYAVKIVVHY